MAPFKQPQKRRKSSEVGTSARNVPSRAASRATSTQSHLRSGSQNSSISRRSSAESSQGQGRRRAPLRNASARSDRSVSVPTTRPSGGDEHDVTTVEPPPTEFDADVDLLHEVIMAVNLTDRGTVGCAYYVASDETLYFMEDVQLGGPDVIDACEYLYL